jgi:hypothetical protein
MAYIFFIYELYDIFVFIKDLNFILKYFPFQFKSLPFNP